MDTEVTPFPIPHRAAGRAACWASVLLAIVMGLRCSKPEGTSIPVDTRRECRNSVLFPGPKLMVSQISELRAKLEESETALAEAKASSAEAKASSAEAKASLAEAKASANATIGALTAARCSTHRREMDDLHAGLCALPVELKELILSNIEHIEAHHVLALSSTFQEAFSLLRALPRTFDFEGVEGVLADHLVRVLDVYRVRSLEKERALELIGVHQNLLCEYACGRNFELLKWANNELDLPWAQYPAGPVSDDILALRALREKWYTLKQYWWVDRRPEKWHGVTMEIGRVVGLRLQDMGLGGAVPAEIGQLTSLTYLNLGGNQLTSVPAEIWQLASLERLDLTHNKLTSVPAEIWQLTALRRLELYGNRLTSVPAEIGQLTSLRELNLGGNQLTSVPAEIWQLTSLTELCLYVNQLTSVPAEIGQLTSLTVLHLSGNKLMSLPAAIGQLTSLRQLYVYDNKLTSLPAEIGQLTSLTYLNFHGNQLTTLPAAIREFRAAGCHVLTDADVTFDE